MKKWLCAVLAFVLIAAGAAAMAEEAAGQASPLPVKVLLLPQIRGRRHGR